MIDGPLTLEPLAAPAGSIHLALAAMAYLALKHAIADYGLQTPYQWRNKSAYGHPGGLIHSGLHAVLTLPVFLILPAASAAFAAAVIAGEFVVHYHLDWVKEQLTRARELTPQDAAYWRLHGVDQLLHTLTYVVIVGLLSTR